MSLFTDNMERYWKERKKQDKIRKKGMKIKENIGKIKKKKVKREPNWQHILKEPYCMTKTSRGLKLIRDLK
jgi:hypothetical protein